MATTDFGTDVSAIPDLDPTFAVISGPQALGQDCVKRLSCAYTFYATNATLDLRTALSSKVTDQTLYALKIQIENVLSQDERLQSVSAALDFTLATQTLAVTVLLQTATGPFQLVLSVTPATVALVSVSRPQTGQ